MRFFNILRKALSADKLAELSSDGAFADRFEKMTLLDQARELDRHCETRVIGSLVAADEDSALDMIPDELIVDATGMFGVRVFVEEVKAGAGRLLFNGSGAKIGWPPRPSSSRSSSRAFP